MQQWQQPRNPQYHIWNQRYQKDTLKDKTNRFEKKNKRTDTKEQPQQHLSINQAQQQERPKGFFQEERGSWLPKASHILKDKKRHTRAHNRKNGNEKQVQKYSQIFQCHFGADPPRVTFESLLVAHQTAIGDTISAIGPYGAIAGPALQLDHFGVLERDCCDTCENEVRSRDCTRDWCLRLVFAIAGDG